MTAAKFAMRGYAERNKEGEITSGGTLLFFFSDTGRAIGLDFYKEWLAGFGPKIEPGCSIGCCCEEGTILLSCPIHAVDLGADFEGL